MIETIIVPIVKNKCGNLSDSNNCRPIALATIISKLFESAILLKCEMFLDTCPNQFGFKKGHGTHGRPQGGGGQEGALAPPPGN